MYNFVNVLQTVFESCGTHETTSNAHRGTVENLEGEKSLRRPKHRWKDNINMEIIGMELKGVYRFHLLESRGHGYEYSGSTKCNYP
jgi:hypothetical protein